MQELIEAVQKLSDEELERANKKFPMFHSQHEAYGVIKEEIKETEAEYEKINDNIESFFYVVMKDSGAFQEKDRLVRLKQHAMLCAYEAIQVAAMAQKAIDSMEKKEEFDPLNTFSDEELKEVQD